MTNGYPMIKNLHSGYVIFSVIAGFVICMIFFQKSAASPGMDRVEQNKKHTETEPMAKSVVHLYFADKNNSFLKAEERDLLHSNDPIEFGKVIVEALIDGPRTSLMRTIPESTKLKAFYNTQDGTAYIDLSDSVKEGHPGGAESELFTIYSMVNSLVLNIPEIHAVKFLINGKESMTLNGHIDLRSPFKANMLLIR
jgi:spore germination protein GerM